MDLLVGGLARVVSNAGELTSNPGIESETVVTAYQLEHIFRGIIADTFDALHLALELGRGQLAGEPTLDVYVSTDYAFGKLL